jgi:hypothetical protein
VTGRLLSIHNISIYLFLLSAAFGFFLRRVAVLIGFVAVLLALPLYAFFIAPGAFRALSHGEWSVPPQGFFVWNSWALAATAALIVAAYIYARGMKRREEAAA